MEILIANLVKISSSVNQLKIKEFLDKNID